MGWCRGCEEDSEGHWVNMQRPCCPIVHVLWVTRHPLKGPASVVNQCPWTAQPQTDKEQALAFGLTVSSFCHAHCPRHPRQAAVLHAGNQSWAAVQPFWLCAWCDCAAVWFAHNLGVSAGVFEVACAQRPSRSAVRSGRLLGWALAWLPV